MTQKPPTAPSSESAGAPFRLPVLEVLGNPSYRLLWSAGWPWHASRWMWMIISGYLVLQLTGSTFLTQLVGVSFSGPMLVLGVLSGVLADSFPRRNILLATHFITLSMAILAAALILTSYVQAWHILALTVGIGITNPLDMATRRSFISDIVSRDSLPFALALESMSMTGAMMVGPWIGGSMVDLLPLGAADAGTPFLAIVAGCTVAITLLLRVKTVARQEQVSLRLNSALATTVEGLRMIAGNRAVIGTLGITVLVNLFYFSYTPLIPVFASKVLDVSPTLMGLLAGSQGAGALLGSAFIASRKSIRRSSNYYIFGSLLALASLFVFSMSRSYPISLACLLVAGFGVAGFGTMQAALVLLSVSEEVRGRAMGVVNMAIGGISLGMLAVGALAELLGPGLAVALSSATGFIITALWSWRSREMRRL